MKRLTRSQLVFLQSRRDQPNSYPHWGSIAGMGGARLRMAKQLIRDGYLAHRWDEIDFGWQVTDKGREALAEAKR